MEVLLEIKSSIIQKQIETHFISNLTNWEREDKLSSLIRIHIKGEGNVNGGRNLNPVQTIALERSW